MRLILYSSMIQIARDNLALALKCLEEVNTLRETLKSLEGHEADYFLNEVIGPVETKLSNYCSVTLVFSALGVEGYIYDYAARNLTDNFVDTHLDKLDVVSKWVVIPKLVTGKDFPKDREAFSLLKQLVQHRNYIVHNKSVKLIKVNAELSLTVDEISEDLTEMLYSDKAKRMLRFGESILDTARAAIRTLDELAVVIESLDPAESTSVFFHSPVGRAKEQYIQLGIWPWRENEQ